MTAVLALLRRDLHVSARTAGFWLAGSLTQPILIALVFANIFPRLGTRRRRLPDRFCCPG